MKKFFALLLVVLSVISFAANAESTDSEILFRDIPWGISIADAAYYLDAHKQADLGFDGIENAFPKKWDFTTFDNSDTLKEFEYRYYGMMGDDYYVAGYYMSHRIHALPGIKNGVISSDPNDSIYVMGEYSYSIPLNKEIGVDTAFADLKAKLSSLYGEYDDHVQYTEEYDLITHNYDYYVWKGANNTAVKLELKKNWMSDFLTITYWDMNYESHLAALNLIAAGAPVGNTDGL